MPRGVPKSGERRERVLSPERAREERARLQAQLERIEQQDRERYAVIGRVVAHHAEADQAFAQLLRELLDRAVTDRGERMCVGLSPTRRGGRRRRGADVTDATDEVAATMTGEVPLP